jgi:protease I
MKVLILIADGFEDVELFTPWHRLQEEGIGVTLASPGRQAVTGRHGYVVEPDMPIREVNPAEYDLLLIPGGDSPEALRLREEAVDIARTFKEDGRHIAAISYGLQLLISAGALDNKEVTCVPGIRDDVRAAGANYHDEAVCQDGSILTCRGIDDLPMFCKSLILVLSGHKAAS